jgi:hypothetical protein
MKVNCSTGNKTSGKVYSNGVCFPTVILYIPLFLIFIYFRYKFIVAKLITLHIQKLFFLCEVKYSTYQKIFEIEVVDLHEIIVFHTEHSKKKG